MSQRRGFTLVEVLLALIIMGVVTGALYRLLNTNQRQGNIEQNYALLFIIALLAFVIDFLIRFFQRGVFQWRSDL